jgi:hypothetical protein
MRTFAPLSLILLAAAAAGCKPTDQVTATVNRDITGELGTGAAGIYVLRSIAGQPLPAVIASHESYHAVMLADTIFLHADGWGGDAALKRVTEDPAAGERLVRDDGAFQYELSGTRLTGEYPCNDVIVLAACAAPPHLTGTLRPDGLDLDSRIASRAPLRYEKVSGPSNVAAIRISPSEDLVVGVGSTLQLSAVAIDAQARVLPSRTASWHAFPTAHATINDAGTIRGLARGVAYVIAMIDGRPDTVRVTVR